MDRRGGERDREKGSSRIQAIYLLLMVVLHCVFKGWSERCVCGSKAADAAAPLQLRLYISRCNLQLVTLV